MTNSIVNIPLSTGGAGGGRALENGGNQPTHAGIINSAQGVATFTGASAMATLAWKLLKTIFGANSQPTDLINSAGCGALIAILVGAGFAYASVAPPPETDTLRDKVGRILASAASILTIVAATLGVNNPTGNPAPAAGQAPPASITQPVAK
jgi:hypothetical protein